MLTIINCSPKYKSNSKSFIDKIINNIDDSFSVFNVYKDNFDTIINFINKSDKILFVYPLYVDTLPSKLIEFFEYLINNNIFLYNKKTYILCNCGFLEASQNDVSIELIKNIINNLDGMFMGYFKIGAGEVIGKLNNIFMKLLCFDYFYKIKRFSRCINYGKMVKLKATLNIFSKRLFCFLGNMAWNKKIGLNK